MEKYSSQEIARTYECGPDCLLKPDILLHWIQEIAEEHASSLEFGSAFCMEKNLAWVEIRLSMKITRMPGWRENVNITTWTYPSSPLIAYRDFLINDADGNTIAEISSQWVLIDATTRRPVALKKLITDFPAIDATPLVPSEKEMPFPGYIEMGRIFTAERHDVDFNHHVNNSIYLVWALNSLPEEWGRGKTLKGAEIAFKKETLPGEEVASWIELDETHSYHSLRVNDEERARLCLTFG